jgi:MFS family permease
MRRTINRKQVCAIVWQYYFLTGSFSVALSFFFSTYSVFLISKGLNLFEINLVNCFFVGGVFLMEVPTGAYADVLGRKNSFVAACFILAGSMFLYYGAHSFWTCVLAEVVGAVGAAFCSGSLEAWVVDSVRHTGMRGELHSIFRREQYVTALGRIGGSLFGGYIAQYDLALPWLCGGIVLSALGAISVCVMREEYFVRKHLKVDFLAFRTIITQSITYGIKRKSVLYVIAFGTLITMCFQSMNMQWQLRLTNDLAFDTVALGWVFVGIALFSMVGSYLSRRFMTVIGNEKRALILSQVVSMVGVGVAAIAAGPYIVLSAFLFHEIGRGMIGPIKRAYMNKRIPSQQRATMLSFDSMVNSAGAFIGLIVGGAIAERYSISVAWVVSALVLAIVIPIFLKLKNGD